MNDITDQARAEVAALEARLEMRFPTLKSIFALIQRLVRADKSVIVGLLAQAAVALWLALGFHASADAVAVASTLVNLAVGWFLNQTFKHKLAAAKASAKE